MAYRYADTMLERGRDASGPQQTGLFLSALDRVTRARRETSRDARAALLHAIGTVADSSSAPSHRRYLSDFDPVIAEQAAGLLSRLTGSAVTATPRHLPRAPVPSWDEVERMSRLTAVIVMRDGGRIRLRLHPEDAASNTARFVRLVRAGWFNGVTFHRVVPNFVVQGGSPGANEYFGDGPFTRDELGLVSNRRGTIGVSTRGRDTGHQRQGFGRPLVDFTLDGEVGQDALRRFCDPVCPRGTRAVEMVE